MPSTLRRLLPDIALILLAIVMTALYVAAGQGGFPLDDSWIHQTYGRNLALTGVWSFVPGVPSTASTSPLYTVVLAAGYWLGAPVYLWTHGVGALALGVTAVLARHLTLAALPGERRAAFVCGLAIVLSWHLIWAAASGMETMIFGMLTLALIAWIWRDLRREPVMPLSGAAARGLVFGVLAGLCTLARPEGIMLAALCGLFLLIARPGMTWGGMIAWGVAAAVAGLIVLAPYLAFNLSVSGGLLPNTAAAKQADVAPIRALGYLYGLRQMTLPLLAGGQLLLIPGMIAFVIVALRRWRRARRAALLLLLPAWGVGLVALYAGWLPAYFQHGRYVIPALPALLTIGVAGTALLLRWGAARPLTRIATRALALGAAVMMLLFAFGPGLSAYQLDVQIINQEMVAPAHWLAENVPPDELLAVHDIGAVGYFAPRPILDTAGLVSPEFIPTIYDADAAWALMRERGARYLMAFPDQLPNDDPADSRLCPVFESPGTATFQGGGKKMTIYALAWDGACPA